MTRFLVPSKGFCIGLLVVTVVVGITAPSSAQGLPEELVLDWNEYVSLTEARINDELQAEEGFLVQDFQDPAEALRDGEDLLSGELVLSRMKTVKPDGKDIKIRDGKVHHWRGAIFIPGVTIEELLEDIQHPDASEGQQEDVLETRVLDRRDGSLRVYLRLVRSKIVTVTYNTEHLIQFRRHTARRASSRTTATKIAELADPGTAKEREKTQGQDRGFLWRLNSYWRYEEVTGGVLVECESLTLTRSIPLLARLFLNPIASRIAKESMKRTLSLMRERMAGALELKENSVLVTP